MIMEQHFLGVKISSIFFIFFVFPTTPTEVHGPHCKPVRCGEGGPDISFPFYLDGQPEDCGVPGFKLICRSNTTMIRLPFHRDLVIKSISYRDRRLGLLDPGNCVHEVFLNLNLSRTPFKYYYTMKSYNYVNCSKPVIPGKYSLLEIPCLSGLGYHVYTVENPPSVEANHCRVVKTAEIPFPYSPYLSDSSFGLGLIWESTGSCDGRTEGEGGLSICSPATAALIITIFILLLLAAMTWVRIHNFTGQDGHFLSVEMLLADGEGKATTA